MIMSDAPAIPLFADDDVVKI